MILLPLFHKFRLTRAFSSSIFVLKKSPISDTKDRSFPATDTVALDVNREFLKTTNQFKDRITHFTSNQDIIKTQFNYYMYLKKQHVHFTHLKQIHPYLVQYFPENIEFWYDRQVAIDESIEAARYHVELIEDIAKKALENPNLIPSREDLMNIVKELSGVTVNYSLLLRLCQRLKNHSTSEPIPTLMIRTLANINTSDSFSKAKTIFESYRAKNSAKLGVVYADMAGFHIKRGEFIEAFQILFTYCKRDSVAITVSGFAKLLEDLFVMGRFDLAKRFFEEMHFIYRTHDKLHLAFFHLCLKYNDLKMAESLLPLIHWDQVRFPSVELYLWRCISRAQMDKASQLLLDLYPSKDKPFPYHPANFLMIHNLQNKNQARALQIFKVALHSTPTHSVDAPRMLRNLIASPFSSIVLCLQAMKMCLDSGRYLIPSLAAGLWQKFIKDNEHRSQLTNTDFEDFFRLMTQLLLKGYRDGLYLGIHRQWMHQALKLMHQDQAPVTMPIFTVVDEYFMEIEAPFKERELWRRAVQHSGLDKYFKGRLPDLESHLTSAKILKACNQMNIKELLTLHQAAKQKNILLTFDTIYAMLNVYRKMKHKEAFEMGVNQLIRKLKTVPDPTMLARRSLELHEFALSGYLALDNHEAVERYLSLVKSPIPLSVYMSTYFNSISSLKDRHESLLAKIILAFFDWNHEAILQHSNPEIRPQLINQVFWAAQVLKKSEITDNLLKTHLQDLNAESLMYFLAHVQLSEQNIEGKNLVDQFLEVVKQEKPVSMGTIHALMKYLDQTNDFKRMDQLWNILNVSYHLELDADIVHIYLQNLVKQPGDNSIHAAIFILRRMLNKFELNSVLVEDIISKYFQKIKPKNVEDVLKLSEELSRCGYLKNSMARYFMDAFSKLGFPFLADEFERELNIV